ncbi:DUF4145 domain-containing protein [Neobacillus cucumis]|uniref:DUF4145 domain-containing protein n=1 Tax=Neobacillus cucumis TaxID=1740721 RepID=UPI001963FF0D|nr:DUF4145 domain-containing protein [Neobacillus cucumis]MBM7655264.1 hypothetical protein [Neobacillus cucumis]
MNNCLFDFVREFSDELADLAHRIEAQLFNQPQSALIQARLYCEKLVKKISDTESLEAIYPLKPAERIHKLYRQDIIPEEIYLKLEWIRKMGNKAAHDLKEIELKDILEAHKLLFEISVWYMEVYVSHQFTAPKYQLPVNVHQETNSLELNDLDALLKPYFDQTLQKVDEMREVFERQLEAIKADKENISDINAETGSPQQQEDKYADDKESMVLGSGERLPLSKEKENIVSIFKKYNFNKNYETTKAIELEHLNSKELVYLINNKKTSIVLNPKTIEMNDDLKSTGKKFSSTALKQFPKAINKGKTPINYGYLYNFGTDDELETFLQNLNDVHLVKIKH